MNYLDIQNSVNSLLNRRDVTTAQIQGFIQNAMQRIQRGGLRYPGGADPEPRPFRVPAMEKTLFVTIAQSMQPTPGQQVGMVIPTDLLELINLIPNSSNSGTGQTDYRRLEKVDITTALQYAINLGVPRVYAREGGVWVLGPAPSIGDIIQVDYYAELSGLVNSTDTNILTIIAPDLLVYGALCYAGDFYSDIRLPAWESRFREIWNAIADQGLEDEENGGTHVMPAFGYPDDLDNGWDYFTQGPFGMF